MVKIERLLATTITLLVQRRTTARALAERFEVSLRTIYRDIDTLKGAGIPVATSQGHDGGLSIPANFTLNRQLLTYEDMVSILTSLSGLNNSLNSRDIARVIDKITALIPEDKKANFHKRSDTFLIDISPWSASSNFEDTLHLAHQGIAKGRMLRFEYTDGLGKQSSRAVEPHTLLFKSFTWYLFGFCHLRQAFRSFRLSRIRIPQLTTTPFNRRPFDPKEQFRFQQPEPSTTEIVLRFSPAVRAQVEDFIPADNLRLEMNGSTVAVFPCPPKDTILPFVLSFGENVEILSPSDLRAEIRKKIDRMQKFYDNLT